MLYVPLVLGGVVAGGGAWRVILLGLSATFVFFGRESGLVWWRAKARRSDAGNAGIVTLVCLGLAAIAAGPLIVFARLYGLALFGAASAGLLVWNARQAAKREERTMTTELLGIAGLTLTAPAAYYAGRAVWSMEAMWLWLLSALYFASSVFYVKLRVLSVHSRQPRELARIRRLCFGYHLALAAAITLLAQPGRFGAFLILAFAPILVRAFWHLLRPGKQLVLKRIGLLEVLYSVVFLVFSAAGFQSSWLKS
jgi:hypothetical protein